ERRGVVLLEEALCGERPDWGSDPLGAVFGREDWARLTTDQRNALIFEASRDRPLEEVLAESRKVFQHLLGLVEALPEAALEQPHPRYPGGPLWELIAGDSYAHYRDHVAALQAWLARQVVSAS